ncbi:MAG: glycoside hydrolase domain-containing protein [Bacteroidota bacterium]
MNRNIAAPFLMVFFFLPLLYAGDGILKYVNGNNSWNADSLGNHRIVVRVSAKEYAKDHQAVSVKIPWRRRDEHPELKGIIVIDTKTQQRVKNVYPKLITRESGELIFEPTSGPGDYFVYYLLYKNEGRSNYPKGVYRTQDTAASADWLAQILNNKEFPKASADEYQSIDQFNSFYPMEIIATEAESRSLIAKEPNAPFILFPEVRTNPIRMKKDLPLRWIQLGKQTNFTDTAKRSESFTFQIGLFSLKDNEKIAVDFTDLKGKNGTIISSKMLTCFNTEGISYTGVPFQKNVDVMKGEIQPLWCGIEVPTEIPAGTYNGKVMVSSKGNPVKEIALRIVVRNEIAEQGGIGSPELMTRLHWLNSTIAQQNDVIPPYVPLEVKDSVISLLGRKVMLHNDGFPSQIQTFFTQEMTSIGTQPNDLFTEPAHFHFYDADGKQPLRWKSSGVSFTKKEAGTVSWNAENTSESLQMDVNATLEFDGFLSYSIKMTALQDMAFKEINFHLPMQPSATDYVMGLGLKGGNRPDTVRWKWDVAKKNQDGAWIGAVNAGLQFSLRDEQYVRPLNTNFYLQKPLLLPTSWGNENKGGIDIFQKGKAVLVNAYSGSRMMKKGDTLNYNITMLITPFHPLNTDLQWKTRFYHKYDDLDTIKAIGASVVNIHHATPINPWINYPFIEWKKMRSYVESAHDKGLKVKIYNTVRELSNRSYELFPLRSLGHEIYSPGKGGGFSWLQEHVGDDYIAAWFVPEIKDAAMVNSGMSRWHNYYVEGMNWLAKNVGIDGIYLDDVAFDRVTMKRIKRVLSKDGHPAIIDLHSANQYNKNDGFNNSANLYMEHFPYLTRLWFGEYFDYEKNGQDFYMTEVSGIPFGLMGEMLQDGGNAWRGMLYGMTNRMPWSDNADPRPLWKVWDDFGMDGSAMIGYWSRNSPVRSDHKNVPVTVYKKDHSALISIASWEDSTVNVRLSVDWKNLGIDSSRAVFTAPEIMNFQSAGRFTTTDSIPVQKGKGLLLIVK